jgi:urease accessory protein
MLPIGGFSYSQGLETAIDNAWVTNEASCLRWINDLLGASLAQFELPLLYAMCVAQMQVNWDEAARLNQLYLASRETSELRAETVQMGNSLLKLLRELPADHARLPHAQLPLSTSLPFAWGLASYCWSIDATTAVTSYCWTWCENQVAAAMKALPMGQQAGQRIFSALLAPMQQACNTAATTANDETLWSNFAPGFAICSSQHEVQYSRLFRS